MSVNKSAFIERLAKNGGIKKKAAKKEVELFLDTLVECLKEDKTVKFNGFGYTES